MTLAINIFETESDTSSDVERRHYTVGQLIAELKEYDGETEIVIKNCLTGKYGAIDFQGLSVEA